MGGTTLINWTSSFRTPAPTLEHWAREHGVKGHGVEDMAPWFDKMEQRLGVAPWWVPPTGRVITVKARHYVLAGGAINSPALLMRSQVADPHKRLGRRTFLHLTSFSSAVLDYSLTPYAWDGIRRAFHSMAEIQFAGGAKSVRSVHEDAAEAKTPGEDPRQAVCDSLGRHHQLQNLSIHDGSLFPTSIGANPQLSVYGLTAQLASGLVDRLRGSV